MKKVLTQEWKENEASYFARCLLMPEDLVKEEAKKIRLTEEGIAELAEKFGVEPTCMAIRLGELLGRR